MLAEALEAYLAADAGMKAILGLSTARKDQRNGLYPVSVIGTPSLPYVVHYEVGTTPLYSFQGQNRLQSKRYRFSCYGSNALNAKQLARALWKALSNIPIGIMAVGDIEMHGSYYIAEVDGAEPEGHNTIFGVHVDFEFWFLDTDSSV